MSKQKVLWECTSCGHTQPKWTGSCSQCSDWNSFVEQLIVEQKDIRYSSRQTSVSKPVKLKDVILKDQRRIQTSMKEFDRLLGGGAVIGSLTLIGGDPGVGKSTLMLQIASNYSKMGLKVLYVCGEESVEQTTLRAQRLQADQENLYLFNETLFSSIQMQIDQLNPDIIVVDSVQIIYKADFPSAPGSVVQVREITSEFLHIAKGRNITTFLIGHVTKSGELAGPKVLEHLVDTVLDFEGDKKQGFRLLRSVKNRFGPTDDIALFQMNAEGLSEIKNPSLLFLKEKVKEVSGSVIVPTVEGVRSILIEIQALVTTSVFSAPSRKCAGLDTNRLALLLAVLEKRVGYQLFRYDVFVSIAGGMRITEPAIDLGVVIALASSFSNHIIEPQTVVIGEVGLAGEVRGVSRIESRLKEAKNMGFNKVILPEANKKSIDKSFWQGMEIKPVSLVEEAIEELII